jgi:predicted ATPase
MIKRFKPGNFKCFVDDDFLIAPLTLLTGVNGSGKSSLIQALLLAHQAAKGEHCLKLNGPNMLQLGHVWDVRNMSYQTSNSQIVFEFEFDANQRAKWVLSGNDDDLVLNVDSIPSDCPGFIEWLSCQFHYLCAERIGPRDVSIMDSRPTDSIDVGTQGEFVAQVLEARGKERIREEYLHPLTRDENVGVFLSKQVERWLCNLVPKIELRTQSFPGTNSVALRLRRTGDTTDWFRPTNMAFGVTYALPIIVAGLLAPPGSLLIVENPEAHLHPSGQSQIGRFLATIAAGGVKIIVETHSDHFLNGIRLASADNHPLRPEDVIIHHFNLGAVAGKRSEEISITANGGLSKWPRDC